MSDVVPQRLFRTEAINAQRANWIGPVVLIQPLSIKLLSTVAGLVTFVIVLGLIFLSYTQRVTVHGEVAVIEGYSKVLGTKGTIVKRFVGEGQLVTKGQALFAISNARHSESGETSALVAEKMEAQRKALVGEQAAIATVHQEELDAVKAALVRLRAELGQLEAQIAAFRRRLQLAKQAHHRTVSLYQKGFYSREGLQQREGDVLEAQGRLDGAAREKLHLMGQLDARTSELRQLPARHAGQRLQLERALHLLAQESAENDLRSETLIRAPQSGLVTGITGDAGRSTSEAEQLLAIIPARASRIVHLFANSAAIAFVQTGTPVLLRFQAYPYQKFGHGEGQVSHISLVPLTAAQNGEPLYRVTVTLSHQRFVLTPGMRVDAEMLLDTRRLYEWAFEPIFGMSKNLADGRGNGPS
jgi:membrane fusion protein